MPTSVQGRLEFDLLKYSCAVLGPLRNSARPKAEHRAGHQEADLLCAQRDHLLRGRGSSRPHQQHPHRAVSASTLFTRWAPLMQFAVYKAETRVEGDHNRRLPKKDDA